MDQRAVVARQHSFYASPDHRAEHGRRKAHLAIKAQAQDPIPSMIGQKPVEVLRLATLTFQTALRSEMGCKAD